MRINQYLARAGVTSRRKAEDLIITGKVSVNGEVVTDLSFKIEPGKDEVTVNGKCILLPTKKYYMMNKPKGYTCTRSDPHAKRTIFELLPEDPSLVSVGRLDVETTGLLLVTNDGLFAQNMIHPSKKIEKEYLIETGDSLTDKDLNELRTGVKLDDGEARAVKTKRISERKITLTVEEGRKRIIRRMIRAVGGKVVALERARIGELSLDVPQGKYRDLTEKEIGNYA